MRKIGLLALVIACGGDDDGTADDGSSESTGGILVMVDGAITGFGGVTPLEGAEVCVRDTPEVACATSDAMGRFSLVDVPAYVDTAIIVTAEGQLPSAVWSLPPAIDIDLAVRMLSDTNVSTLESAIGGPLDPNKAHILALAHERSEPVPGATFSIAPASGTQLYVAEDGTLDPSLGETQANGVALWANVDPSEVELTTTHATAMCTRSLTAIPGSNDENVRLPLLAGHVNSVAGNSPCR